MRSGNGVGDGGQVGVAAGFGEDQSELTGKFAHVGDLQTQAVVGHAAGDRVVVLDDIKAVHRSAFLVRVAASGKALRVTNAGFDRIQEIAIDRQNNIGAAEIRNEANVLAKRNLSGRFSGSCGEGIIFRPEEVWEFGLQIRAEAVASGRTNRFGQNGEALTIAGSHGFHEGVKRVGARGLAFFSDFFGAVWIVEIQDFRLGEGIRSAIRERMERVALKLGRTSVAGRGDQWHGAVTGRHRGRVVEKLAGNRVFHAFGERNEERIGAAATGEAHAGERDRGAHEFDKITLRKSAVLVKIGSARKFLLEVFLELRVVLQLTQATPDAWVFLRFRVVEISLHRWQPPQVTGGFTSHSSLNFMPISRWVSWPVGFQAML